MTLRSVWGKFQASLGHVVRPQFKIKTSRGKKMVRWGGKVATGM